MKKITKILENFNPEKLIQKPDNLFQVTGLFSFLISNLFFHYTTNIPVNTFTRTIEKGSPLTISRIE